MNQTVFTVIVISDEFIGGFTPRDVLTTHSRDKAMDYYRRQRDQRINAHTHVKQLEIDHGRFMMCSLRGADDSRVSISLISNEII